MGIWLENSIDSICDIVKGQQLNKLDLEKEGEFPCINGGIEPSGYTDKCNRLENTITISEGGNSCGYINYLKMKFWSGGHCYTLLNIKESFDTDFIYYALKGKERKIMGLRVGSGLPNIQQKAIKSFEIKYPKDKPEQTRIAEILSTTDESIAVTEALIAKYQRIKTGLMQDLLTRGIDEHGNIRSKETHKFVVKNGIDVPKNWEVVYIEEFASKAKYAIVDGPFGSNLKIIHYRSSGIPVIQSGFVTDNKFNPRDYLFVDPEKLQQEKRSKVKPGDIIMAKIGANCGTCAILPDNHPTSIIAGNCLKITVGSYNSNKFLEILLHFLYENGKLDDIKSTTAQPAISMAQLKVLYIPRPSIDEQIRIVSIVETIDNSIQTNVADLNKLYSLKTGLMQDLLSGKVRVKINK